MAQTRFAAAGRCSCITSKGPASAVRRAFASEPPEAELLFALAALPAVPPPIARQRDLRSPARARVRFQVGQKVARAHDLVHHPRPVGNRRQCGPVPGVGPEAESNPVTLE